MIKATHLAVAVAACVAATADAAPAVAPRQVVPAAAPLLNNGGQPSLLGGSAGTGATSGSPSLLSGAAATTANTATPTPGTITFVNNCAKPIYLKYESAFTNHAVTLLTAPLQQLAPGSQGDASKFVFQNRPQSDYSVLVVEPYYAPEQSCPVDCSTWGAALAAQTDKTQWGPLWMGQWEPYAAVCNPTQAMLKQAGQCCSLDNPNYDAATGDCPGINIDNAGTRLEWTFAGDNGFMQDSVDLSTNYKNPENGNIFFNIPVSISADSTQCNHVVNGVNTIIDGSANNSFPLACYHANCSISYQSSEDSEGNGGQIQCPPSTNYVITYCPN